MKNTVSLDHIAIQCKDKEEARLFFEDVLHCPLVKSFTLSSSLSKEIFLENRESEVLVFEGVDCRFEVFISKVSHKQGYNHICITVPNKKKFIDTCNQFSVEYFQVQKGEKKLLFVRDFSNNLYEIKTK